MIRAYPLRLSEYYRITGDSSSETYNIKEVLKRNGAVWDYDNKYWIMRKEDAERIPFVHVMVYVRVASHCHMNEHTTFVTTQEYNTGYVKLGCPKCDTPENCGDLVMILNKEEQE